MSNNLILHIQDLVFLFIPEEMMSCSTWWMWEWSRFNWINSPCKLISEWVQSIFNQVNQLDYSKQDIMRESLWPHREQAHSVIEFANALMTSCTVLYSLIKTKSNLTLFIFSVIMLKWIVHVIKKKKSLFS